MRIDVETCRDPDLLAGEVRRLRAVIESGQPTLTDLQRAAIEYGVMLCEATAGTANDRATIDGASSAADVLRGLLDGMNKPTHDNEPSLASAGSQPVGWGAVASDGSVVCMMRRRADVASYVVDGTPIVPLYRQPQPTLTDEERDVLDRLAHDASYQGMVWTERVLRGVLERLK